MLSTWDRACVCLCVSNLGLGLSLNLSSSGILGKGEVEARGEEETMND